MNSKAVSFFISSLTLALATGQNPAAIAGTSISSTVISSTSSVSGSSSTAEATLTGQNGVIIINGDRVEVKNGKLSLNGVSYGTVGKQSVVKYTVQGRVKKLLVDGVERKPD